MSESAKYATSAKERALWVACEAMSEWVRRNHPASYHAPGLYREGDVPFVLIDALDREGLLASEPKCCPHIVWCTPAERELVEAVLRQHECGGGELSLNTKRAALAVRAEREPKKIAVKPLKPEPKYRAAPGIGGWGVMRSDVFCVASSLTEAQANAVAVALNELEQK